jgi:hypothetical protein
VVGLACEEAIHTFLDPVAIGLSGSCDTGDATGRVLHSLEVGLAFVETSGLERHKSDVHYGGDVGEVPRREINAFHNDSLTIWYAKKVVGSFGSWAGNDEVNIRVTPKPWPDHPTKYV